jgi:hypothetical protein
MRHLVRPLTAVTITAAAASLGALAVPPAIGWLHARALRSDRSLIVGISSKRIVGLYPGAKRELIVTFHNQSKRRTTVVRNLRVGDVVTTKRRCAGSRRNLRIRQYSGPPLRLRPDARRTIVLILTMPNTVANACQRATFTIHYHAETWVPSR